MFGNRNFGKGLFFDFFALQRFILMKFLVKFLKHKIVYKTLEYADVLRIYAVSRATSEGLLQINYSIDHKHSKIESKCGK